MGAMRMCVACRERQSKNELIRIVCVDNRLIVDVTQTAAGRGASLHQRPECVQSALTRGLLRRALKVSAQVDVSAIEALAKS